MGFPEVSVDAEVRSTRLLECVLAVSAAEDLDAALRRVVGAAVELVGARYGALGILGRHGRPDRFVYVGLDDAAGGLIGPATDGTGVLRAVADHAEPLCLDDVTGHRVFAGFPPDHPPMLTFMGAPIRWGGEVLGRLYVTDKADGSVFTDDDEAAVKTVADAVAMAMHHARDFEEARRGKQWLEAAGDVTTGLLGDGDTDRALRLIAGRARELSASDTAMVLLPSDPGVDQAGVTVLRVAVCVGVGGDVLLDLMVPVAGSTSGEVLADQKPRMVPSLAFHAPGTHVILGPAMVVPLGLGDDGSVLIAARTPGSAEFEDDDLTRLTVFAENAALALHLAQTQRRRELRVLADRDQLARDLYDHVMQRLFSVGLSMQITRRRAGSSADTRMGEHVDDLQSVIRTVRQAIFDLPTPAADLPRVRTSLAQLVTALTADAPLMVSLRLAGPLDDLPIDLAGHARAVLGEAVGNAVRHSHADELAITITVNDDLVIDVTDNGIGIGTAVEGLGLATLHRLAADVAGTFTGDQADCGGTHLLWTAPMP
ncbi:MAG TPA: GAF domain-containing protein [Nakamurella sp.]|nr:GAF domain-containing protein [Nakamurella sp.]